MQMALWSYFGMAAPQRESARSINEGAKARV
jgi:hypothetical protein